MDGKIIYLLFACFIFANILSTGCTTHEPGTDSPIQIRQKGSPPILTPDMKSEAIAIALNDSEIRYYREHQIDYQIMGVESSGFSRANFIGETHIDCPMVKIKTNNAYLYLYIDLENRETFFIARDYMRQVDFPKKNFTSNVDNPI